MKRKIIAATIQALKSIKADRFFSTERGYHGAFYCELRKALNESQILDDRIILEMEYQKSASRHNTNQRPDIVLHVPAELSGRSVRDNNLAIFALKRRATESKAKDDFSKLNEMFNGLRYPLGFFVNVASNEDFMDHYTGRYRNRIHAFSIRLIDDTPSITHAFWRRNAIVRRSIP